MHPRRQTKYVTRTAIERCIRELNQAVEDLPYNADPEMKEACLGAVDRLRQALNDELDALPEA